MRGPLTAVTLALALVATGCGSAETPEPTPASTPTPTSTSRTAAAPTRTTASVPSTPTTSGSPSTPATSNVPAPTTPPRPTTTRPRTTTTTAPRPTTTPPRTTTTTPPKTTTTAPTCDLGALAGKDLERLSTTKKVVALTFDAGSSDKGAQSILGTLSGKGVPATFFLTGRFTQSYPSLARQIAAGYPVGNHTQTHPDLTTLSRTQVVDEIRAARATIKTQTGAETRPLFRFPFGARNTTTIGLVNDECYVAYRWTTDTLGWKGTDGGMSADKVYQRVMSDLQPGQIVLMHIGANPRDGTTLDADALPRIIDGIRAQGYTFVTLPR
jgi:peptidoglycan/xylan/chitin deacetylase (PgdA/CDA1 family)